MSTDLDLAVAELAVERYGVFDLAALCGLGVTRGEINRRLASRRWVRLYRGVFMLAGVPRTWRGDLFAACLAAGPDAVASHRSAAELWGLPGRRGDFVEIMCPRWRRGQEVGPVVHESKAVDPGDRTVINSIPVTSAGFTLLTLGAVCAPVIVEMALDVALLQEVVSYTSLRELLKRVGRRGRNGSGVLRGLVEERSQDHAIPESPMETRLLRLLRDLGFPAPVPQYEVWHNGRFYGRLD